DRAILADPDAVLAGIGAFNRSEIRLGSRAERVSFEDAQPPNDALPRFGGQLSELPGRGLGKRDPKGHSSSNGMNSSSSKIRFHRASCSLMEAFSISSRMTASYVCPLDPNRRSNSLVSFRSEIVVVVDAITTVPWSIWYLYVTMVAIRMECHAPKHPVMNAFAQSASSRVMCRYAALRSPCSHNSSDRAIIAGRFSM